VAYTIERAVTSLLVSHERLSVDERSEEHQTRFAQTFHLLKKRLWVFLWLGTRLIEVS